MSYVRELIQFSKRFKVLYSSEKRIYSNSMFIFLFDFDVNRNDEKEIKITRKCSCGGILVIPHEIVGI